eukprot:CAMPEP_0197444568 /NCGR_PEP_ID=MMETSP1175-20131217/10021_1 /TAXON_ID=1003142 /ORGANISM="Triceratium dubium, Strain CCMP147" /LENGTH=713 /DNA_ID=CAMNT_0042975383 /DNA_START=122 /DNA_END=2263 /DNA_ORIENTATION=-
MAAGLRTCRFFFVFFCCATATALSFLTSWTRQEPRECFQKIRWCPVQYRRDTRWALRVRPSDKIDKSVNVGRTGYHGYSGEQLAEDKYNSNMSNGTIIEEYGSRNDFNFGDGFSQDGDEEGDGLSDVAMPKSPFPTMPSQAFLTLADSQFELLASSLLYPSSDPNQRGESKVKSMALYLPQENPNNGQLEFLPTALYPCPSSERVFIASHSGSGLPLTLPRTLTKLPGFAHAQSLIPTYPFSSSVSCTEGGGDSAAAVGAVEEVMCDVTSGVRGSALSVPIYFGSQTVGVLLVWPSSPPPSSGRDKTPDEATLGAWTEDDKSQVSRSALSLALALSMDNSRATMQSQKEQFKVSLADNLHQLKNPLQAMRTYAKLLQRKIAMEEGLMDHDLASSAYRTPIMGQGSGISPPHLLSLAENMLLQSDRVVDLLSPMDSLVNFLDDDQDNWQDKRPLLGPWVPPPEPKDLMLWSTQKKSVQKPHNHAKIAVNESVQTGVAEGKALEFSRHITQEPQQRLALDKAFVSQGHLSHFNLRHESVGDFETEMAFVPDVLRPIILSSKEIASENGIDFEVVGTGDDSELPGVCLCPKSLQEAVANLLDNAIKYVTVGKKEAKENQNPSPKIRVTLMPNQKPYKPGVTVVVEDNGPGIPPSEREAVFRRGFRGNSTKHIPGSGIGLDLSLAMVSRMGGILEVVENKESQLDGAVVQLVLFREP